MNRTQRLVSTFDLAARRAFLKAVATPMLNLADSVGYQRAPFETFAPLEGGFSSSMLFVLRRCQEQDRESVEIRESVSILRRGQLFREGPVLDHERRWKDYRSRHEEGIRRLAEEKLPWENADAGCDGHDLVTPWPDADEILADFVFRLLEPHGFRRQSLRVGKNTWKCWTTIAGRRTELAFDKGSAQTAYGGGWFIPDFNLAWHISQPFFYSGGSFRASQCHPYILQLESFFGAYEHVFPYVWEALEESILSGNGFLKSQFGDY